PLLISHQKICPCRTDAFDICRSALFKNERTIRHGVECFAHVNTVRYAVRFHAGGNIYSIAPHIIREAHVADDAGCCMAPMPSYPWRQTLSTELVAAARGLEHCQREPTNCPCSSRSIPVEAGHRHIAITNGFDLVSAKSLAQFIECANKLIEVGDHLIRGQIMRRFRKPD